MTRALGQFGSGLVGAAVGWALLASPLASMFAPTRVTWDATSCPAGVYSITSIARNAATGGIYFVAGPTVSLPTSSVAVEFPNLPAGTYSVTASGRRDDGQSFGAAAQTVRGLGPSSGFAGESGRTRPPSVASTGRAAARKSVAATVGSTGSTAPRAAVPLTAAQGSATAKRTVPAPKFSAPGQKAPLVLEIDSAGRLVSAGADWRRLEVFDTDADGLFDIVCVEMADGEIWILRVKYS